MELIRLLREAEQHRFTAEELQAALAHCGSASPITWLLENWPKLIDTVQNLSTKYGQERKENIIGTMSAVESRDALRMHKGNVWHAVTECIQQRQRKFNEIMSEGSYAREDVVWALTAHQGSVDLALMDLAKSKQIRPFMMKVWGPPMGVENESGNRMELAEESIAIQQFINDNLDRTMANPTTGSGELTKPKVETESISLDVDNSPSILRDIEKLIGNMELKQSQQNEDMLHNIESILGHVLSKHSSSRPMSSSSNFSMNSFENTVNVKSPLPIDLKSTAELSDEHADRVQQNVRAFMEQHIQDVSPDLVEYVENDLEMYDFRSKAQLEVNSPTPESDELHNLKIEPSNENTENGIENDIDESAVNEEQVQERNQPQSFAIETVTEDYYQERLSPIIPQVIQVHAIEHHIDNESNISPSANITEHVNPDHIQNNALEKSQIQPLLTTIDSSNDNVFVNETHTSYIHENEPTVIELRPQVNGNHRTVTPTQLRKSPTSYAEDIPKVVDERRTPDILHSDIQTETLSVSIPIALELATDKIPTKSVSNQLSSNGSVTKKTKPNGNKTENKKSTAVLTDTNESPQENVPSSSINNLTDKTTNNLTQASEILRSSTTSKNSVNTFEATELSDSDQAEYNESTADAHKKSSDNRTLNNMNKPSSQKVTPVRKKLIVLPQMLMNNGEQKVTNVDLQKSTNPTMVETNASDNNVSNAQNTVEQSAIKTIIVTDIKPDCEKFVSKTEQLPNRPNLNEVVPIGTLNSIFDANTKITKDILKSGFVKSKANKKRRNRKKLIDNDNLEYNQTVAIVSEKLVSSTLEQAAENILESFRSLTVENISIKTPNEIEVAELVEHDLADSHEQFDEVVNVHVEPVLINCLSSDETLSNNEEHNINSDENNIEENQHAVDKREQLSFDSETESNDIHLENFAKPCEPEQSVIFNIRNNIPVETLPDRMQEHVEVTEVTLTLNNEDIQTDDQNSSHSGTSSPTVILDRTHKQNLDHLIDVANLQGPESDRSISPTSTIDASCIDDSEYSGSETEVVLSSSSEITTNEDPTMQKCDKNTQNLSEMVIDTRKLIQQMKDEINSDIASFVSDDSELGDDDDDDEYTDYEDEYSDEEDWDDEEISEEEEEIDEETENVVGETNDDEEEDWTDGDSEYYEENEDGEQEEDIADLQNPDPSLTTATNILDKSDDPGINGDEETETRSISYSDGSESEYYEEEVIVEVVLDEYPESFETSQISDSEPILPPMEFLDVNSPEPFQFMIEPSADEAIADPNQITPSESLLIEDVLPLQQSQSIAAENISDVEPLELSQEESSEQISELPDETSLQNLVPGNPIIDNDILLETIRSIQHNDSIIQTIQKSLGNSSTLMTTSSTSSTAGHSNNVVIVAEDEISIESSSATTSLNVIKNVVIEKDTEDQEHVTTDANDNRINQSALTDHPDHQPNNSLDTDIPSQLEEAMNSNNENNTESLTSTERLENALPSSEHLNNSTSTIKNIKSGDLSTPKNTSPKKSNQTPKAKVAPKKIPIRKSSLPGIFGPLGSTNVRAMQQEFLNKQPDNGKPSKIVPPKVYKKPGTISSSLSDRITKFIKPFTNGNASKEIPSGPSRSTTVVAGGSSSVIASESSSSAAGPSGTNKKIPKKKYHETCFSDDYQTTEDEEEPPQVVAPARRRMPLRQQSMPNIMRLDLDDEETFEVIQIIIICLV